MVDLRFVINQIGLLLLLLSAVMLSVAVWAALDWVLGAAAEPAAMEALLGAAGVGLLIGALAWQAGRSRSGANFGRREAMLLVALSWLVGAALAALPFWLWAQIVPEGPGTETFGSYLNCYFEAMSGLTTTGATILTDIESLPRGLLLWRALTQWLGGLGIVVLFVAVLPTLGVGGKRIFHLEAPGPTAAGVRPRIRETARVLWMMYLGLTAAEILALRLCGLSWFDAFCHTFTTVASGGFANYNSSIGAFNSVAQGVIILFMFLAGVNFGLYYQLLRGNVRNVWRETELRFYLLLVGAASALVIGSILLSGSPIIGTHGEEIEPTVAQAIEHGLFTAVSLHTSTGYATVDYDRWSFLPHAALLMAMFIGGSAGSTAGGLKVLRIWIMLKVLISELRRAFQPQVVRPVRVGRMAIDNELKLAVVSYVLGLVLLFVLGAVGVMLLEGGRCDFTTAASASVATLFNVGPGFAAVGPVETYAWFGDPAKALLCALMVLGRLEVFALLVLFMPAFWQRT